ncbi:heme-binding protein [Stutzerimonas azotifigens]|uniref:heme-binding protein n=1 Tax=Stutzerimonas azotifigens TaxID=291995 RepID=UPI000414D9BA|nr:heme-binding protein [Stutzerimonas azotifigens]
MGRRLLAGLWDVEAAIYAGPPPRRDPFDFGLRDAEAVLRAARAEAERNDWAVAIAVVDAEGHPFGLIRLDGGRADGATRALDAARQAVLGGRRVRLLPSGEPAEAVEIFRVEGHYVAAVGVVGARPEALQRVLRAARRGFDG